MSRNILMLELRQNRRAFITCLIITLVFILLLLGKADAFVNNPQMEELIRGLPDGLLKSFGIVPESFQTFEGYLATQVFPYVVVIVSSFAAAWAAGSIAKESDRGTGEYLFSLPYRRSSIFWSKACAHWLHMTVVYAAATLLLILLADRSGQSVELGSVLTLLLAGYLLILSFMGIGYGLTSLLASDRTAVGIGTGIAIAAFLLDMLSGSSEMMERLSAISPYRLFDPLVIVKGGSLTAAGWIVTLGLYAAGTAAGVTMLRRKDIN